MKTVTVRRILTYFAALCYALFLFVDFFMPQASGVSSGLKYAGLLACVTIAIVGEDGILRSAMLLTAACDYLLLFTKSYVPGVLAFACAQALHAHRHAKLAGLSSAKTALPASGVAAAASLVYYILTRDALTAAAVAYAVMLIMAGALSIAALVRGKCVWRLAAFASGGMVLFVLCDASVAAFNLGVQAAAPLMWLFYLPSQYLLASSGRKAPDEAQTEMPPGWHMRSGRPSRRSRHP